MRPRPREVPGASSAARLAFGCGAVVGCAEAARALAALPHLAPAEAIGAVGLAAGGHALLSAAVAWIAARLLARWEARGRAAGVGENGAESSGAALASGAALGLLVTVARARVVVGLGQPGLAHLLTGPLLEGIACGGLIVLLAGRVAPRRLAFAWRAVAAVALVAAAAIAVGDTARSALRDRGRRTAAPSVVLISVDTLRADRLGAYGHLPSLTPNLDRLAADGVVFETVRAPVGLTGPSHTSMLTGLYPVHHGARVNGARIRDGVETLPEILARRGYRTAGFVSGWTMTHRATGLASRFETYDQELSRSLLLSDTATQVPLLWLVDRAALFVAQRGSSAGSAPKFRGPDRERPASRTVERAERWLSRHRDEPFFLFVHLFDPHEPYSPSIEQRLAVDPGYAGDIVRFDRQAPGQAEHEFLGKRATVDRIRKLYEAEIADTDLALGRLLDTLRELGLAEETLVVFTADHGEGLGEHGELFAHGGLLYDTVLRVPLIVRPPRGVHAGTRVAAPARLVDLAPTILDFTGGAFRAPIDGSSLSSSIAGGEEREERVAYGSAEESRRGGVTRHFVQAGSAKLVWTLDYRWRAAREPAFEELFDLAADPGETVNLAQRAEQPAGAGRLRELLRSWVTESVTPAPVVRDPEVEKQLRALGYV